MVVLNVGILGIRMRRCNLYPCIIPMDFACHKSSGRYALRRVVRDERDNTEDYTSSLQIVSHIRIISPYI